MQKRFRKPAFSPYKGEKLLTIATLEKLRNRRTVSKQFISELSKNQRIKQAERDVIQRSLSRFPDGAQVPIKKFATEVKKELVPIKAYNYRDRHSRRTLSPSLRG